MGEIRDAIETLTDVKAEFAEVGVYASKRSISASAMEGTANFPVLAEDSISLDDGILISRALEKKYAAFLTTVLTMDPYLEVEKGHTPTASEYLKQFHQNMRVKDPEKGVHINMIDFLKESYDINDMDYTVMEGEVFKMACAIYEGVARSVPQDKNILLNYSVEEVTTPDSLNSRFCVNSPVTEANGGNNNNYNIRTNNVNGNVGQLDADNVVVRGDQTGDIAANTVINIKNDNRVARSEYGKYPMNNTGRVQSRNQWKVLTDDDCKKANDMVPTLLHIRVYPIDKYTREELTTLDFVMGVKATLHPIPVNEIARMVVCGMRNENFVFNFIRWTTGEIKFFKDFLFAIDTIKMDAKDSGNDVTGWRPALKRRKNKQRAKLRFSKNSVMPNTTLVVSQGATEYIKENYGYDLEDDRIIRRMMDTYFLLGFVSVNTVNQRASFRYDGIDYTDTYTFDTLKRENQSDDKAFKNMMKMLGRSM